MLPLLFININLFTDYLNATTFSPFTDFVFKELHNLITNFIIFQDLLSQKNISVKIIPRSVKILSYRKSFNL